jgi:HCOMODA/2-hydroxy-3-carboxy-muconic semialdehyde decarboxylase
MDHLEDLVAAYRILAEYGVIDAYGHVSLRSPTNPQRYYLGRSLAPERVQLEDIIEYDLDSTPLNAQGRESVTERFIHGEIYKARPDVLAVVHNHSPSVVPFSCTGCAKKPPECVTARSGTLLTPKGMTPGEWLWITATTSGRAL